MLRKKKSGLGTDVVRWFNQSRDCLAMNEELLHKML